MHIGVDLARGDSQTVAILKRRLKLQRCCCGSELFIVAYHSEIGWRFYVQCEDCRSAGNVALSARGALRAYLDELKNGVPGLDQLLSENSDSELIREFQLQR